ncbi:hypothetical protein [Komarekiella delphini-convector]|nr:hypothetical protein [Komarekiella delphini-convector]
MTKVAVQDSKQQLIQAFQYVVNREKLEQLQSYKDLLAKKPSNK